MLQLTEDLQLIPGLLCKAPRDPSMLTSLCGAEALTVASRRKRMQLASTYKHPEGWAASLQKTVEY